MENLIIIGSGPAGLTAAIYAARANLEPLVFEGNQPGGQLTTTTTVENYPGFPEGVDGPQLMQFLKEQAQKFGAKIILKTITRVNFKTGSSFRIFSDEEIYESRAAIIAAGAHHRRLGIPSEEKYIGRGVSYCATCDGYFFRDKNVAIVGGGDTALEEANFLSALASNVYLIHRRDAFRASSIMVERVKKRANISLVLNKVVEDIFGDAKVEGLRLKDVKSNEETELKIDGVFIAIGHNPNTEMFQGILELDKAGYIMTRDQVKTSISGVFAAGDCADSRYRQAVVAAGMGCQAALEAQRWLET